MIRALIELSLAFLAALLRAAGGDDTPQLED